MPPNEIGRPGGTETAISAADTAIITAQQTAWLSVHDFVSPMLAEVGSWPMLGTPAWVALHDDDPRKWAALLDGARHWALRLETCQEARAEASRAVSTTVDWPALSREINRRNDFYTNRPWLKRVAS
jgi:hypothetical protein